MGLCWTLGGIVPLLAACSLSAGQMPGPETPPSGEWREQIHWVPMQDEHGATRLLYTRICRPYGDTPARVVLIAHGAPPDPAPPDDEAGLLLERGRTVVPGAGYMAVAGMRRSYGQTGGAYAERATHAAPMTSCGRRMRARAISMPR